MLQQLALLPLNLNSETLSSGDVCSVGQITLIQQTLNMATQWRAVLIFATYGIAENDLHARLKQGKCIRFEKSQ